MKNISERYPRIGKVIRGEYTEKERKWKVEEDLRDLCRTTAWMSFWFVGIWFLLLISPLILICLLCRAYAK